MADDNPEDDLFADLYVSPSCPFPSRSLCRVAPDLCLFRYDGDDAPSQPLQPSAAPAAVEPAAPADQESAVQAQNNYDPPAIAASSDMKMANGQVETPTIGDQGANGNDNMGGYEDHDDGYMPIGIKEDG